MAVQKPSRMIFAASRRGTPTARKAASQLRMEIGSGSGMRPSYVKASPAAVAVRYRPRRAGIPPGEGGFGRFGGRASRTDRQKRRDSIDFRAVNATPCRLKNALSCTKARRVPAPQSLKIRGAPTPHCRRGCSPSTAAIAARPMRNRVTFAGDWSHRQTCSIAGRQAGGTTLMIFPSRRQARSWR